MTEEVIGANEAGQRLDKYLRKYFPEAPSSFLYKMLRKKNITLNGIKSDGSERLVPGDKVILFLAADTIAKFRNLKPAAEAGLTEPYLRAYSLLKGGFRILYEDGDVLLVDKMAGLLTQKATISDVSLNEAMIGYLLHSGFLRSDDLHTFKPSICNRLDRNTSGIVICGKSLAGLQQMSLLLKERSLHKFYLCLVAGRMEEGAHLEGYLHKEKLDNKVVIYQSRETLPENAGDMMPIQTNYKPLQIREGYTLVEVELITGKTHQIRAHLASVGFPILGDPKYGNRLLNERYRRKYGLKEQLLHAYRVEFPLMTGACGNLSCKVFTSEPPELLKRILEEEA